MKAGGCVLGQLAVAVAFRGGRGSQVRRDVQRHLLAAGWRSLSGVTEDRNVLDEAAVICPGPVAVAFPGGRGSQRDAALSATQRRRVVAVALLGGQDRSSGAVPSWTLRREWRSLPGVAEIESGGLAGDHASFTTITEVPFGERTARAVYRLTFSDGYGRATGGKGWRAVAISRGMFGSGSSGELIWGGRAFRLWKQGHVNRFVEKSTPGVPCDFLRRWRICYREAARRVECPASGPPLDSVELPVSAA